MLLGPPMKGAGTLLGLVALSLVWGTQYLVIREGLQTLPPLTTAALRFAVVAFAAQVALWICPARRAPPPVPWRLAYGLSHAASMGLLYWGQARIDSAIAGVLVALSPLLVALTAHRFVPGERFEGRVLLGTALGFAGAAAIAWRSSAGAGAGLAGVLAVTGAAVAGASTRILAKRLTTAADAAILLRDFGVVVAIALGIGALLLERPAASGFTPIAVAAFLYLGLVASAAATGLYLVLLRRISVARMSYLQFASAAVALLTGVLVGGETLGVVEAAGAALILVGLLSLRKKST